jgi:hypothetical protein
MMASCRFSQSLRPAFEKAATSHPLVFQPSHEAGSFKPRDGGLHLGVGLPIVALELGVDRFIAEEIGAGKGHQVLIVAIPPCPAQSTENLSNVAAGEL